MSPPRPRGAHGPTRGARRAPLRLSRIASVLLATARELGNGRPVPGELCGAVRRLADALRRQMQPPSTHPGGTTAAE
jgi:hypothetical protein